MSGTAHTRSGVAFWAFVALLFAVLGGGIWATEHETRRQRAACEAQPGRVLVVTRDGNWCVLGERRDAGR